MADIDQDSRPGSRPGAEQRSWNEILKQTYRRALGRAGAESSLLALAWVAPFWLLLLALGMLMPASPLSAWIFAGLALAAGLGGIIWGLRRYLRRRSDLETFGAWLEQRADLFDNEFINALRLELNPLEGDPLARHLIGRVIARARKIHHDLPIPKLYQTTSLRRPGLIAAAAGLIALLLFVLSPVAFRDSLTALTTPASIQPPLVLMTVAPGDISLDRGSSLDVTASVESTEKIEAAHLLVKGADGVWRSYPMTPTDALDGSGRPAGSADAVPGRLRKDFSYHFADLQAGLTYLVATESDRSRPYQVTLREPLRALGYRKILEWPSYTKLPRQSEVASHGDFSALLGTRATLQITASRPGAEGAVIWNSGDRQVLRSSGGELEGGWIVAKADTYRVSLRDTLGGAWRSEPFVVSLLDDLPPVLRVLSPTGDLNVPTDMQVILDVECVDDYGLGELVLIYSRAWEPPQRLSLGLWESAREARITYPWDLEDLGLLPGTEVSFFFELSDNDAVLGPKITRSAMFTIRFPSLAEMYTQLEEEQEQDIFDLGEMLDVQEKLQDDLEEISRELKKETELSWEKQQEIQEFLQDQKNLGERLEEVAQSLNQSLEQMEQQSLFTPEMASKLQQIRELVNEIQSEEFHEYMNAMQEAMNNLSRRDLEQAMEDFKFSQQDLQKGLDRTLELLKRLMAEEKLGRLQQEVEKLAMEQKALNEQLAEASGEKTDEMKEEAADKAASESEEGEKTQAAAESDKEAESNESTDSDKSAEQENSESQDSESASSKMSEADRQALQEEQKRIEEETKRLEKQLEELSKMSEESLKQLAEQMKELQRKNLLDQAQQNMQQSQQSMSQGKPKDSLRFGRKAQQNLAMMSQQLQSAKEAMEKDNNTEITRKLFAIANNLVFVSQTQEGLVLEESRYSTDQLAVEQQALLEETRTNLDSLFAVGRETPVISMEQARLMGEALRKMDQSVRHFERGSRQPANVFAMESREAIDSAIAGLLQTCSGMSKSSCSNPNSQCQNKLQGLGAQQSRLNQDSQSLMGQSMSPRLTPAQGDQMKKLAARQEMIRRGLEDVNQQMGDQRNVLGRLDDLAEEMKEIAEEMRQRGVDEKILKRQEKILSRLLTAQRSLRKQDEREERISKPGGNSADRSQPQPLPQQTTRREALMRGILRGGQDPIPAEYRRLVEEYWKALMSNP
ncbi:MAG: hypothetical protein KJ970_00485 [Candidatus Eisenbacteria bacterium]|uniref:DUF4175 domain-containing protein n=1 Tax=Eiseniibacteriota bacterium TaxID=2212470 RepID=A0A948RRQ5_UNCEI|nr:hypothetical protein [Candidatus Eisenbacteria bacterium]